MSEMRENSEGLSFRELSLAETSAVAGGDAAPPLVLYPQVGGVLGAVEDGLNRTIFGVEGLVNGVTLSLVV
jgi:hypothetical protein